MLDLKRLRKNINKEFIKVDSLAIHNQQKTKASNVIKDDFFLDDDFFDEGPELHFRVRNVSGFPLENLEVEIKFYDSGGGVIGTDSDFRLGPLSDQECDAYILYIDSPGEVTSAELNINCQRKSFMNKLFAISKKQLCVMILTVVLVALFFYFQMYLF